LEPTEETDSILENIRRRLRHATTRAVTVGYGPRYLHSTGQFHKGGPAKGIFLQITVDDAIDVPVPGKPFTFGILKQAQALGDLQALLKRERPVLRLHIKGDIETGLSKIQEAVEAQAEKHI